MNVKEIVDYMIKEGTESTNYGAWNFGLETDIAAFSEMSVKWLHEHQDEIYDELLEREEVAEITEYEEDGVHIFDICFYRSVCPNIWDD